MNKMKGGCRVDKADKIQLAREKPGKASGWIWLDWGWGWGWGSVIIRVVRRSESGPNEV